MIPFAKVLIFQRFSEFLKSVTNATFFWDFVTNATFFWDLNLSQTQRFSEIGLSLTQRFFEKIWRWRFY